ncbi:WD40 repeat domain-containing protein [Streptomyces chiangmaiensis]|uniref:WD40 repeat domain-containing protein n=1 Tax=Streptomyces chiangmaiensis TaxID=766497 RepID=A0ABU7FWB0_9ACTN|nr:WD40 repeat domain-containing protein [Streptomyces chiangmaiensis]MED7828083.1 WD40 repeat domain-containing protein [Streptomyces chiangmaiensis]
MNTAARQAVVNLGDVELMVIALAADDTEVLGFELKGKAYRWNLLSGAQLSGPVKMDVRTIWTVPAVPDNREIVIGCGDGTVRRLDRVTGSPLADPFIAPHPSRVRGLAHSRDAEELVSAHQDGTVRRWKRTTGSPLGDPLRGHAGTVRAVALTPEEDEIVSVGQDGTVRRWKREDGTPIGPPLVGHTGGVQAVGAGPSGVIASGGRDGTVRRWDRRTGKPLGAPLVTGSPVRTVLLTRDGEIAAGCADGTLHRWDPTGQRIGEVLPAHTYGLPSMALTRDETELVTYGWDGAIRRWARITGEPTRPPGDPDRAETRVGAVSLLEIRGTTPF